MPGPVTCQSNTKKTSKLFILWALWMTAVGLVTTATSVRSFLSRTGWAPQVLNQLNTAIDSVAPVKTQ